MANTDSAPVVRFVVIDETILCYVDSRFPSLAFPLEFRAGKGGSGGSFTWNGSGFLLPDNPDRVRSARLADEEPFDFRFDAYTSTDDLHFEVPTV